MHFVDAKGILSSGNGMNLYRGCTHGCIYCDSRSRCYQFTHEFEDIEVKRNAPELLERALRSKRKKCMIGTGAMCDPYMHCEEELRLTRQCLEIIDRYEFRPCHPDKVGPDPAGSGFAKEHQRQGKMRGADDSDNL